MTVLRIYTTQVFARWQKYTEVTDVALRLAVEEMQRGLIDARLGGGVVKKRVARPEGGKRSGYRTLVATNVGDTWFFMYGFAKNERDNIENRELRAFKLLAKQYLAMSAEHIQRAIRAGQLKEIPCGEITDTSGSA
jgi:hypothetical protein